MWTITYIVAIIAINIGFSYVPLVPLPTGDMFPPLSFAVGIVFVLRDFAQREVGHWVLLAMGAAAVLSYLLADPFVALASVLAFAASELVDWAMYSWTKRPLHERILWSSAVSTPVDSLVFLGVIGLATAPAVAAMVASKMVAAIVVWWWWRRTCSTSRAQ